MDRAFFYACVVGGAYAIGVLLILGNAPIAATAGVAAGLVAMLRGALVWG